MESLRLEQDKLDKKGDLSRTIDDVQKTIDLLVAARQAIAAGMPKSPSGKKDRMMLTRIDPSARGPTLAKLKRPVKASLDQVNSDIKDIYSAHKDYSKALDKVRPSAASTIGWLLTWLPEIQTTSDAHFAP